MSAVWFFNHIFTGMEEPLVFAVCTEKNKVSILPAGPTSEAEYRILA
jgi:hypothetical protein